MEEEKAKQAPVSTPSPLSSSAAPVLAPRARADAPAPHSSSPRPPFDTSTPTLVDNSDLADTLVPSINTVRIVPTPTTPPRALATSPAVPREARTPPPPALPRFPIRFLPFQVLAEPPPLPPSQWPEHVRAFIYDPNLSWADDLPEPVAPVAVLSIAHAPRNWAPLRSVGAHPWRAIRRRKRRLRVDHWERPTSHFEAPPAVLLHPPQPVPPSEPPLEGRSQDLPLRPADLLGLTPLHSDDPIHPDDVPPDDLPAPSLCLFPDDHPPSEFPVATEFGEVFHELAHACSRALPASQMGSLLRDTVWPQLEYLDGSAARSPDARPELVALLSPDQLVFLCAILVMGHLEPPFALFFDNVVVDFVHSWVHHCELIGEPG